MARGILGPCRHGVDPRGPAGRTTETRGRTVGHFVPARQPCVSRFPTSYPVSSITPRGHPSVPRSRSGARVHRARALTPLAPASGSTRERRRLGGGVESRGRRVSGLGHGVRPSQSAAAPDRPFLHRCRGRAMEGMEPGSGRRVVDRSGVGGRGRPVKSRTRVTVLTPVVQEWSGSARDQSWVEVFLRGRAVGTNRVNASARELPVSITGYRFLLLSARLSALGPPPLWRGMGDGPTTFTSSRPGVLVRQCTDSSGRCTGDVRRMGLGSPEGLRSGNNLVE